MNSIHKYLLCLVGLLAPLGVLADTNTPSEFAGYPTWYDYRDISFSIDPSRQGTFLAPIVISTPEQLAQLVVVVLVVEPVEVDLQELGLLQQELHHYHLILREQRLQHLQYQLGF